MFVEQVLHPKINQNNTDIGTAFRLDDIMEINKIIKEIN